MLSLFLISMVPATVALGLHDVFVKKLFRAGVNEYALLSLVLTITGLFWGVVVLCTGIPYLAPGFWTALITTILINVIGQIAWYKAFLLADVSLVAPFRLLVSIFVLITGFLLLKETPSVLGVVGILVTIIGLWLLMYGEAKMNRESFLKVITQPGVLWALLGVACFSVSFPFDKKAVVESSAVFFTSLCYLGIGVSISSITLFMFGKKVFTTEILKHNMTAFFTALITLIVGGFLAFYALNFAIAAYASNLKRLQVFWSVLFSGAFLKEQHIGRKLIATGIMLGGLILTVLLG